MKNLTQKTTNKTQNKTEAGKMKVYKVTIGKTERYYSTIKKGKILIEGSVDYDSVSATDTYLSYTKNGGEVANISKINVIE